MFAGGAAHTRGHGACRSSLARTAEGTRRQRSTIRDAGPAFNDGRAWRAAEA